MSIKTIFKKYFVFYIAVLSLSSQAMARVAIETPNEPNDEAYIFKKPVTFSEKLKAFNEKARFQILTGQATENLRTLTTLSPKKKLGDKGVKELAQYFSSTPNLKTIVLSDQKVGDEGFEPLVLSLPNTKVGRLDVSKNKIQTPGFERLVRNLYYNPTLKDLDMSSNQITVTEKTKQLLLKELPKTHVTVINLAGNTVPFKIQEELKNLKNVDGNAIIFDFPPETIIEQWNRMLFVPITK